MHFKILFENENLIAVDKPSGIAVYDLMKEIVKELPNLKKTGSAPRYGLIHRLDQPTSGILLIAKNDKALKFFQKQFKQRKVVKKYLGLVTGEVKRKKGKIKTLIGRDPKNRTQWKAILPLSPKAQTKGLRRAETDFKVKQRFEKYTLLELKPVTGRPHQIRVHLAHLQHPLVGDQIYGFKNQPGPENLDRLFLHATELKIKGLKGQQIKIKSNLPQSLNQTLKSLK